MRLREKVLLVVAPVYVSYMVIHFAGWEVLATAIICLALSFCIAWGVGLFIRGLDE